MFSNLLCQCLQLALSNKKSADLARKAPHAHTRERLRGLSRDSAEIVELYQEPKRFVILGHKC